MWSTMNFYVFLVVVTLPEVQGQVSTSTALYNHDQCIDQAFTRFHQAIASKFPQYDNFTVALPSSRHLFNTMLNQNFTMDTLKDYCRTYETARKEYDQCSDSSYKRAALSGFGLADYICLRRLNDYANGLPCLERADRAAADACRGRCSQYERASYSYLHPTETQTDSDMTTFMAGDCQYLKCWTDCRYSYLESQCGNMTAKLEFESLVTAYSNLHELYDTSVGPSATPTPSPSGAHLTPHFPDECRPFLAQKSSGSQDVVVVTGSSGSTKTYLMPTTHGGASKGGAVKELIASALVLWTIMTVAMK